MAQQLKALVKNPGHLSLIVEPVWKERTDFTRLSSDLYTCTMAQALVLLSARVNALVCTHTHTHT